MVMTKKKPNSRGEWRCSKCKTYKPSTDFRPNKSTGSGLMPHCRECHTTYMRYVNARSRYGVGKQELDERFRNGCDVCGSFDNLHIDHDHKTNKTRGTLCNNCNLALGYLHEDPARLLSMIDYIGKYNAIR